MASFYLLVYVLIVGALIIGFSFRVDRQDLSLLERIGHRVVLCAAMGSANWLLVRSQHNEWRKRQADRRARR